MEAIGRYILIGGIILIVIGGLVLLAAKLGLPLGHLPGDIRIVGKNGSFYFPLTTCIVISIVLSLLLTVISRFWKK